MTYQLDTSTVVAILRNRPATVRERLRYAKGTGVPIGVSSIVLFELWFGVARSTREAENSERLRIFLAGGIDVLPFDAEAAARAGALRSELESAGTPIGPYDVLIAAQALSVAATLVTANVAEFARVRGLHREDWSASG